MEGGGETISRAKFIETYVELRLAALQSGDRDLTLEEQRGVLGRVGVTEEELLAFVEYWGTDGEVMVAIWEDVDSIMRETRVNQGEEAELRDLDEGDEEGGERPDPGGNRGEGEGGRP